MTSVLIVDDRAGFRRSARELLESEGFEVVGEAADGEEALRVAGALGPEVVLLDVGQPCEIGHLGGATDRTCLERRHRRQMKEPFAVAHRWGSVFGELHEKAKRVRELEVLDGAAVDPQQPRRAGDVAEALGAADPRDCRRGAPTGTPARLDYGLANYRGVPF